MSLLRRHFDTCFVVLQVWIDGLVIVGSCLLGYRWFQEALPAFRSEVPYYGEILVLVVGVTLVSFWGFGMYRYQKSILNVEEHRRAFYATVLSLLVTSTGIFLLRAVQHDAAAENFWLYRVLKWGHDLVGLQIQSDQVPRALFLFVFTVIFLATTVQRAVMFKLLSWLHTLGLGNTNVAIYGTGPIAQKIEQKLRIFPTLGYRFVGFLDDDPDTVGREIRGHAVLGGRDDLEALRVRYDIKRVLVAKPELEEEELMTLCEAMDRQGIHYQVVPRLYHFFAQRFSMDNLDSIPLITRSSRARQPFYQAVKSAFDRIGGLAILILALPVFAILAFLIKRQSPGPVFFKQLRVGIGGRPFEMIKFRTMYTEMCGDEEAPQSAGDPRVTPVGRFLRATSLDELPQIWNVLRGEMSLVGPRPEMPFIVDTYSPVERIRLEVKPGITGLWQVSEARRSPIHENLDYDLYYIENRSVFLDLMILLLTVLAVLRVRGTF